VGHLVQPSCRSRVTYSSLHRTLSRLTRPLQELTSETKVAFRRGGSSRYREARPAQPQRLTLFDFLFSSELTVKASFLKKKREIRIHKIKTGTPSEQYLLVSISLEQNQCIFSDKHPTSAIHFFNTQWAGTNFN